MFSLSLLFFYNHNFILFLLCLSFISVYLCVCFYFVGCILNAWKNFLLPLLLIIFYLLLPLVSWSLLYKVKCTRLLIFMIIIISRVCKLLHWNSPQLTFNHKFIKVVRTKPGSVQCLYRMTSHLSAPIWQPGSREHLSRAAHLCWNATSRRGSRMFSSGSHVLYLLQRWRERRKERWVHG